MNWLKIGVLAGLAPGLVLYALLYKFKEFDIGSVILFCLGIPGGGIGAYIGKGSVKTAWIAAILGAIIVAGLFIAFIISSGILQYLRQLRW